RRQTGLAGVLVALLGLVAVLTSGGGDQAPTDGRLAAATVPRTSAVTNPAVGSTTAAAARRVAASRKTVAVRPVATLPGAHRAPGEPVPILMYHVIGTRGPLTANPGLWVAPADFGAQVAAMRHASYHAVTLQDVWNAWHRHGKLPRK